MKTKNEDPVAAVEKAKQELEKAESQRAALDVQRGDIDDVLTRRRELQERVELCRERLELATSRAAVAADAETETEIAILIEQASTAEAEIEAERERVEDQLRRIFLCDWLDGAGRFSSCQPQGRGLIAMASSVQALEEKRAEIVNQIARLQNRLAEGKAARDRAAAAARVESRRRLLAGETVKIPLTPWRIVPLEGHTSTTAANFANRKIPAAIPPETDREIHCLIPVGAHPSQFVNDAAFIRAEKMDAGELCDAMSAVWKRSR